MENLMNRTQRFSIYKRTVIKQKYTERFIGIVLGISFSGTYWFFLALVPLWYYLLQTEKITEPIEHELME
jgi:hypothetical protein